tara:strand:+ start:31 stop:285 length:255 start_codon:yes stop_codon:yes gene_type:complete
LVNNPEFSVLVVVDSLNRRGSADKLLKTTEIRKIKNIKRDIKILIFDKRYPIIGQILDKLRNGGPWAIRTPDQWIKNPLLYRLS